MSLLESLGEAIDAVFEALQYDEEEYIRRRWWRFFQRVESDRRSRSVPIRPSAVWPPFWGHRVPLGGDWR